MNKSMMYAGLLSILSTTIYADRMTAVANTSPGKLPVKLAANAPGTASTGTLQPVANPVNNAATPATAPAEPMSCNYKLSPELTHVDEAIIIKWAEKAGMQSFDFNNNTIDQQLIELKSCFTDQGWQSFSDALSKSGNLNAIKSQKLMVGSSINGKVLFSEIKNNQWKVTLPMQVLYRNDKEKLTQLLSVELIIGRKTNGDLGIMQMIASPNEASLPDATTGTGTIKKP